MLAVCEKHARKQHSRLQSRIEFRGFRVNVERRYIYIYIYLCVYMYISTLVYTYGICVYIYIYLFIYLFNLCMYVCMHACMHVCMYVCVFTCHIYIYIFDWIQGQRKMQPESLQVFLGQNIWPAAPGQDTPSAAVSYGTCPIYRRIVYWKWWFCRQLLNYQTHCCRRWSSFYHQGSARSKVSNFPSFPKRVPRGPDLRDLDEGHPQIRDEFPGFYGSLRPHFVRALQQLIHFQLKGVASAGIQPDLRKAVACDSFRRWSRKLWSMWSGPWFLPRRMSPRTYPLPQK